uniref:Uncharacterized protein n=1 Tax=Oryza nivara TaxID=4536 RepID=A0A0E0IIN8_ORYNI
MAKSEKAMGSPAVLEPVKTPPPPATDGPISDLMQRQYKEDADATHGTLVGDDVEEARRLFLADVVERLDAATSIARNQPWAAQFIGTMGELACGIGTIKVESVWHRVPTNMASSRIPPSPLVLADGGAAAPMLHTVCLQVKRLEARIHEVCAAAAVAAPPFSPAHCLAVYSLPVGPAKDLG